MLTREAKLPTQKVFYCSPSDPQITKFSASEQLKVLQTKQYLKSGQIFFIILVFKIIPKRGPG